MILSCVVVAGLIAAFTAGILLALALPAWILVIIQSILIMVLVWFILKPKKRR
ncbi:MAG: hypothetical protein IJQ28_06195 [Clostridia bacterium]|nr:hypothetical protein [Clostridia bacterium]